MSSRGRCCCGFPCELADDDFDREDSDDPGVLWHEVSGDYDISSDTLITVTEGVLATTKCHPSKAPLGSFWAKFTLINPEEDKEYVVRAGHPTSSTHEAKYTVTGSGASRQINIAVNTVDYTMDWPESEGDTLTIRLCYAPGVEFSSYQTTNESGSKFVTTLIDETGADHCHSVGGVSLGNFSFIKGDFDNWEYEVHWLENHDCQSCDCFCYKAGSPEDIAGLPDELELTITNVSGCANLAGTYTMYRKHIGNFDAGGDCEVLDEDPPNVTGWWTDVIEVEYCEGMTCCFRIGVTCDLDLISGTILGWGARFCIPEECGDPYDPWNGANLWWDDEAVSADPNRDNLVYISDGTCAPLYLELPRLYSDDCQPCQGPWGSSMDLEVTLP